MREHRGSAAFRASVDALAADLDLLVQRTRTVVSAQLPSYAVVPAEAIRASVRTDLGAVRRTLRTGESAVSEADSDSLEARLTDRAAQDVPSHDVIQAYRASMGIMQERFVEIATAHGVDKTELFDAARVLWCLADLTASRATALFQRLDFDGARRSRLRSEFVNDLLSGALRESELAARASAFGLDLGAEYHAVKATGEALEPLRRRLEQGSADLVVISGRHCVGLVAHPPPRAGGDTIAVGPRVPLRSLAESFELATRIHEWMRHQGMPGTKCAEGIGWRLAVDRDDVVTGMLRQRYRRPLAEHGDFGDLIWASLRAWFAHDRNVAGAAAELVVHPNTLRYRLAKFTEITGVRLESTDTLIELSWALEADSLGCH